MKKNKICFISLGNLYLCPYIKKYISLLNCKFDIIYWDRHEIEEDLGAEETFRFQYGMNEGKGKVEKALGYIRFRKFSSEIIKKNNYDGIIILQTSAGILLQSTLCSKYKNKFILDIRDYTMEKNFLFFNLMKILVKNSSFTAISSKGYEKFLPKSEYIMVHNDTEIDEVTLEKFKRKSRNEKKINISYIGLIRFHEQNKKVIMSLKNSNIFRLKFIGTDSLTLKNYCELNQIKNVDLIDRFPAEKTLDFYFDTDIIFNVYGNNSPLLDYALSNKLYYAAKLKIPILVSPNTYMEKITQKYKFGYTFDINDSQAEEKLEDYYRSIDWRVFMNNCNKFLKDVEEDNQVFNEKVKNFLES